MWLENPDLNIVSLVPAQTEIQFLEDRLYEYNASGINKNNGKLFCKLIYDSGNNIIAGITGWTWAAACEITILWVDAGHRKKGFGKTLLDAAEAEATKENCQAILLRTYSFQSPGFYLKQGFDLAYKVDNFPHGHSQFCFIKKIPVGEV